MPAKNRVKQYHTNAYYHVFNRGAGKQLIYKEYSDYTFFIFLLKKYLSKKHALQKGKPNLYTKVKVASYCLMPNHFHLLIKQKNKYGMTKLMRRISTVYAMYFNNKYEHSGHLFQDVYKAVHIKNEKQFRNVVKYIHDNPAEIVNPIEKYRWSSLRYYKKLTKTIPDWIDIKNLTDEP